MDKLALEQFAQTIENQVRHEIAMDNLIEKGDSLINTQKELIEKMNEEKKLYADISELNRILDEDDKKNK